MYPGDVEGRSLEEYRRRLGCKEEMKPIILSNSSNIALLPQD